MPDVGANKYRMLNTFIFDIFIDTCGHFCGCDDGDEVVVVDDCGSYHFIIKP